jgi:hypothetical protein
MFSSTAVSEEEYPILNHFTQGFRTFPLKLPLDYLRTYIALSPYFLHEDLFITATSFLLDHHSVSLAASR